MCGQSTANTLFLGVSCSTNALKEIIQTEYKRYETLQYAKKMLSFPWRYFCTYVATTTIEVAKIKIQLARNFYNSLVMS